MRQCAIRPASAVSNSGQNLIATLHEPDGCRVRDRLRPIPPAPVASELRLSPRGVPGPEPSSEKLASCEGRDAAAFSRVVPTGRKGAHRNRRATPCLLPISADGPRTDRTHGGARYLSTSPGVMSITPTLFAGVRAERGSVRIDARFAAGSVSNRPTTSSRSRRRRPYRVVDRSSNRDCTRAHALPASGDRALQ